MIKINNIIQTYVRKRLEVKRAYPISTIVSLVITGIFNIVFPVIIYKFVFNSQVSDSFSTITNTSNYISYICLGALFNVISMTIILNIGKSMMSEITEGTIQNIFMSPTSRLGYYIGCLFEQLDKLILEALIILIVGYMIGARFANVNLFTILIVLLIALIAFFSMSILISSILIFSRESYLVLNTIFVAMDFLCGVIFPVEYLHISLQWVSKLFPLTNVLGIFRGALILGNDIFMYKSDILFVGIQSIIYIFIGIKILKKMEPKIIEQLLF
ncbi:ABC transporter permease [Peptostreptococcus faecalis]|uniref:ABC transporter permease n=1 Tax=Peptostreptococcus faecalis TaxID=2045015 RepID=UPI000C7BC6D5|nr:ABC transporter permease [Peptostreptococcus faecalis]